MAQSRIPPADKIEGRIAKTTVTSFRIIDALQGREEVGVSELADELNVWKGTVHKHLVTLQKLGYVVSDDGKYRLGLGFLGLGTSVRSPMTIYEVSHEPLKKLADATGETASIMVPEHGWGVYLSHVVDENEMSIDLYDGKRVPLTATAGGKAILSYFSEDERKSVFEEYGLPEFTDQTITDRTTMDEKLRRVRDSRIAWDQGEYDPNQFCVAAPITDAEMISVAAVTVSGPPDRMRKKRTKLDLPSIIGSTATSIEKNYRGNT